jgi:hypothetical protein
MLTDSVNLVSLVFDTVGKGIEFVETSEMASQIIQDRVESYWKDMGGFRRQYAG